MDSNKLSIENSVELTLNYPSVSERYYSHYYFVPKNPKKKSYVRPVGANVTHKTDLNNDKIVERNSDDPIFTPNGEDTCIMVHSNRICVVCISPKHPIILNKKTVTKIDFCGDGFDRLANKVSGKGKRGAQIVGLFSPLCMLHCEDESVYTVYAGIRGKLLEVNERLIEFPNLLNESPNAEGYLAIVLPKINKGENMKNILLPREEYETLYLQDLQEP